MTIASHTLQMSFTAKEVTKAKYGEASLNPYRYVEYHLTYHRTEAAGDNLNLKIYY